MMKCTVSIRRIVHTRDAVVLYIPEEGGIIILLCPTAARMSICETTAAVIQYNHRHLRYCTLHLRYSILSYTVVLMGGM